MSEPERSSSVDLDLDSVYGVSASVCYAHAYARDGCNYADDSKVLDTTRGNEEFVDLLEP